MRGHKEGEIEMKKLFGVLLALVLSCSMVTAFAEAAAETESEFQRVLLKKGSLIIKEFIDYGEVEGMVFQTACLTDVETGEKFYALRIETSYYNSKYDNGIAVGVMDADEIDDAIATLEYVKEHITEMKDYSEIVYEATSGMQVGAFHSDISSPSNQVFIKVSSDSTKFFDVSKIDTLIKAFQGVQATFSE